MKPLVSIIIPIYQVSGYVERCIRSVMNQTYTEIECLIVDDATTDDSIEKCERLIDDYHGSIRFKILHHETNRGLSAARNTGTDEAKGDYLYYLDSDDEITPNCIETLVSFVINDTSIEMVQGNHIKVSNNEEEIAKSKTSKVSDNDMARKMLYHCHDIHVSVWNKLLKRTFVIQNKLYCREGVICEDTLWMFYLLKFLQKAFLCEDVTYYYHIRPNSISTGSGKKRMGESCIVLYNDILYNLTDGKEKVELRGLMYGFCRRYVSCKNDVPQLTGTIDLYKERSLQYGCWYVYFVLTMVKVTCFVCDPLPILNMLNTARWRMKRLFL